MTLVSKTFELYGKTYTFESGELAKQATGACLVKQGDTTMLDTVVVSKERKNYDFFPLTVDFNEKMYAAGRIPGGYLKREGRPSEKATLTARMIDRPIRPSFPDGFRNEVHIVATSLVADQVNPFDVINVMGASLAMTLGGVPFEGPLACVRIGRNVEVVQRAQAWRACRICQVRDFPCMEFALEAPSKHCIRGCHCRPERCQHD